MCKIWTSISSECIFSKVSLALHFDESPASTRNISETFRRSHDYRCACFLIASLNFAPRIRNSRSVYLKFAGCYAGRATCVCNTRSRRKLECKCIGTNLNAIAVHVKRKLTGGIFHLDYSTSKVSSWKYYRRLDQNRIDATIIDLRKFLSIRS